MIKPKALQKGDLIAIAAPASPFDREHFLTAVKKIKNLGFKVTYRKDIFTKLNYLAGDDNRRADELNQYYADPNVRAIFFARGGYGCQRILPLLDAETIKSNPKPVIGFSDITAIYLWLYHHGVGGAFYGPNASCHFNSAPKQTIEMLINALTSNLSLGNLPAKGAKVLKSGTAEGTLIGGCLSLIDGSIGTSYEPSTEGTILFLEDISEPVYKYDRMLTHLKAAGKLRDVKGIVFGTMTLCKNEKPAWFMHMLKDVLKDFPGPIIYNFPTGHLPLGVLFVTLPLGVRAKLTTDPIGLQILEPALL